VWVKGWGVSGKCIVVEEVECTDSAVLDLKGVGDKRSAEEEEVSCSSEVEAEGEPAGGEGLTGDYFDKPFVPRMEDASADSTGIDDVMSDDTIQALIQDSTSGGTGTRPDEGCAVCVPVGSAVLVAGLTSRAGMQYNGVTGVVMSEPDPVTGRQGVRLDAPFR
jgi:hypothetical protein